MSLWKKWLLELYCLGSLPWRRRAAAQWAAAARAPVMVLFYHRVADTHPNAWTCSRRDFAHGIEWIKSHCDVVSLAEAQRRITSGVNHRPAVAITFDDGYAENMDFALPLLVREKVPCTYFVASSFVLEQRPFPHDETLGAPLAPNTPEQLKQIADWGIEIGAHTRTHADLGSIQEEGLLYNELVGSAEDLADLLGRPIRYFAFPYGQWGNLNPRAFQLARDAGFAGVCSAYGGYNFPGEDAFHLQRIHGDPELVRLKNWLTIDPRKLHLPRYEYAPRPTEPRATGAVSR
ncbi:MAG: polysaccharide deacetylase family protein [Planctomycetia bacterium]|nr:polysaccharide deacetylase family protein [Planctomycetia bacterium]